MNQLSVKIAVRKRISLIRNRFLKRRISLAETNYSSFFQKLVFRFFLKTWLLIALSFLPLSGICFAATPSSPDSLKFENAFRAVMVWSTNATPPFIPPCMFVLTRILLVR